MKKLLILLLAVLVLSACSKNLNHKEKAYKMILKDDLETALFEFQIADKQDPDNPEILFNLCYLSIVNGQYNDAFTYYKKISILAPDKTEPLLIDFFSEAEKMMKNNHHTFAFIILSFIQNNGGDYLLQDYYKFLADNYLQKKDYENSKNNLWKAYNLSNLNSEKRKNILFTLADTYEKENNLNMFEYTLDEINHYRLQRITYRQTDDQFSWGYKESNEYKWKLGKLYYLKVQNNYNEFMRLYSKLGEPEKSETEKDSEEIQIHSAGEIKMMNSYNDMKKYTEKLLKNNEPKADRDKACFFVAEAEFIRKNYKEAEKYYDKTLKLNPDRQSIWAIKSENRIQEIIKIRRQN